MNVRIKMKLMKRFVGSSMFLLTVGMLCVTGCRQETDESDFREGTFYMENSGAEGDDPSSSVLEPGSTSLEEHTSRESSAEVTTQESSVPDTSQESSVVESSQTEPAETTVSEESSEAEPVPPSSEPVVPPTPPSVIVVNNAGQAQLSPTRIMEINQYTRQNPAAGCYKVTDLRRLSRAEVLGLIYVYTFPEYPYYAGHAITPEERAAIEANRNVDTVPETVTVQYGIMTDNGNVRTYPTVHPITQNNRYEDFDYFQETMFALGEMVAVLHTSADGQFVFVVGANDKGWVERSKIGFTDLATLQQWEAALMHPAVVTEPYIRLDNGAVLRMGTALPMLANDGTNYQIWYPVNQGGMLQLTRLTVPIRNDISDGYLPFTYEGVVRRMQQMNGVSYGWGDAHLNFDCSSTVGAVYRCFGIYMPRNTGQMHGTGTSVYALAGMSLEERMARIQNAPLGSLLVMPGHVVMYCGVSNGTPLISHNVTRYSENGVDMIQANQCRTTSLNIYTSSGRLYPEAFSWLIVFE